MAMRSTPNGPRDETTIFAPNADGTVRTSPSRSGESHAEPAFVDGWAACAYWGNDTGHPIDHFSVNITVPKAPAKQASPTQWVYLFNGGENGGDNSGILQPVLAWGPSSAHPEGYGWYISSWYAEFDGDATQSPTSAVRAGDILRGTIKLVAVANGLFTYTCEWEGHPSTRIVAPNIPELRWFCTALERYGIQDCGDYPDAAKCSFQSLSLHNKHGAPHLSWTAGQPNPPECNLSVVVKNNHQHDYHFR